MNIDTRMIDFSRPQPSQARSQERVNIVLATAKDLLVEIGYEDMNIQTIAKRAEVTAPSIYRYFPNKRAIISTFADVFIEAQGKKIQHSLELSLRGTPWKEVISSLLLLLRTAMVKEPWICPAQLAIRSDRYLRDRHEMLLDHFAERFSLLLRSFGIQLPDEKHFRVSRMLVLLFDSYMLAIGRSTTQKHPQTQNDFEEVIFAFLKLYMKPQK